MNNVAVVFLGGTARQHDCFWPNYYKTTAGIPYDLIVSHLNFKHIPADIKNKEGNVIHFNKINEKGEDVPHKCMGAYRHIFNLFKEKYDYFVFISDDVTIKRQNWLKAVIDGLNQHEKIGFGGSQIYNGGKRYPHPTHVANMFMYAKTKYLSRIQWEFNSDYEGEHVTGDLLSRFCVGIQIGNKINLAYHAFDLNESHISSVLHKKMYPGKPLDYIFEESEFYDMEMAFNNMIEKGNFNDYLITSPYPHIGTIHGLIDIEPFNNLLYSTHLHMYDIPRQELNYGINIFKQT